MNLKLKDKVSSEYFSGVGVIINFRCRFDGSIYADVKTKDNTITVLVSRLNIEL